MTRRAVWPVTLAAAGALLAWTAAHGASPQHASTTARSCREAGLSPSYARRVASALRARRDVWGNRLLASPHGPTFEAASRFLNPLLFARAADGRPLTDSGVHYLHFAQPEGAWGATSVALHVADGSQILSKRVDGRRLTISVGDHGRERYGSCLRRTKPARLAEGYLPILETRYTDARGVRYTQESFAAHVPETRSLVSFVRVTADASTSRGRLTRIRFTPSVSGLGADDGRLALRGRTYLFFSPGGSFTGSSLKYTVPAGELRTVYVAWLNRPARSRRLELDELRYESARQKVQEYWDRRLVHGARIVVPEQRVLDAERNLLIQNLGLTWRYSIGNPYQQLSSPEGMDVARVMAGYGQAEVSRAILHTALRRKPPARRTEPARNPNWKMGARLVAAAELARLTGDRSFVLRSTPILRRYVNALGRQIRASRTGLLRRERFSSDVSAPVYGLHSQAVVWQGLRSMGHVWREAGKPSLARECEHLALKLGRGLRRSVRAGRRWLPDGTLFVPVRLRDRERPYASLTATRKGSYWNLVMPYALASGLFRPHGPQTDAILAYMLRHGSRLLGLVRAGAYALYGRSPTAVSGSNQVYGLNVARFLADNDQPGQLVLSLYGQLAAAMTPGTFVSGEGVSIAPLGRGHYRSAYLPPNGASNAAFLETLRLMLVHETVTRLGVPRGLELAYATPRTWLRAGQTIEVRALPTSFGRISFTIAAEENSVAVTLDTPGRRALHILRLRLRLPNGKRIASVSYDGRALAPPAPGAETIELPTEPGPHLLVAQLVRD